VSWSQWLRRRLKYVDSTACFYVEDDAVQGVDQAFDSDRDQHMIILTLDRLRTVVSSPVNPRTLLNLMPDFASVDTSLPLKLFSRVQISNERRTSSCPSVDGGRRSARMAQETVILAVRYAFHFIDLFSSR